MKKIIAVCGSGLGSSFMVEINIKGVLKDLGIEGIDVSHISVTDCPRSNDILYVCGRDLEPTVSQYGECIALNNIMDKVEIKEKLAEFYNK